MTRRLLFILAVIVAAAVSRTAAEPVIPADVTKGNGAAAPASSGNLAQRPSEASPSGNRAAAASHSMPAAVGQDMPPATPPIPAGIAVRGLATWCAPTPTQCQGWGGRALLGATSSFRWGDRPYLVRVRHLSREVTVAIVSYCACPGHRLVDLSPWAFRRLAPLSRGVIAVTVEGLR